MSLEARNVNNVIIVRDDKDPAGPVLGYPPEIWDGGRGTEFIPAATVPPRLASVRAQRLLDRFEQGDDTVAAPAAWYKVIDDNGGKLYFDQAEADEFRKRVANGEFEPDVL